MGYLEERLWGDPELWILVWTEGSLWLWERFGGAALGFSFRARSKIPSFCNLSLFSLILWSLNCSYPETPAVPFSTVPSPLFTSELPLRPRFLWTTIKNRGAVEIDGLSSVNESDNLCACVFFIIRKKLMFLRKRRERERGANTQYETSVEILLEPTNAFYTQVTRKSISWRVFKF